MQNTAVIGTQFGDEAKARVVHDFSPAYNFVIRYAGGSNCGGMVFRNGKKYIHHQTPALNLNYCETQAFLASGMVINLPFLLDEIKTIQQDFPDFGKRIIVDPDAFMVLPEHIEEDKITGVKQGTTFQGIKQAYTSKVNRTGSRIYNAINDNAEIIQSLKNEGVRFIPLLQMREVFEKSNLLFEGNQGVMLDLNCGLFPYITSSDTTVSGIYSSGFHFVKLNDVYGVAKGGYITRSGGRPLPTEMPADESALMVERANERGNTTGRARGIGYFDCVALKYACLKGGITSLILTKLDIMNGQKTIKVCHSYGKEVYSPNDFENITPRYMEVQGWNDASNYSEIEPFVSFVEKQTGFSVSHVSFGLEPKHLTRIK